MSDLSNLEYLIENESFIAVRLVDADDFVRYCTDRGIKTSKDQLERLEKSGLFYPIARYQRPAIKTKIRYVDEGKSYQWFGVLQEGEEWDGDLQDAYADFIQKKDYVKNWFERGIFWEPSTRPFQPWATFYDKGSHTNVTVSLYSIFQCITLYNLLKATSITIEEFSWITKNEEDIKTWVRNVSEGAQQSILRYREDRYRYEQVAVICQILSNRYYPWTRTDGRTLRLSGYYEIEDWVEYQRNWNANAVYERLDLTLDELENLHRTVALMARAADPLENWYDLVSFVAVEQKDRLKNGALFAQTLYSMEYMLRLFYKDIGDKELNPPNRLRGEPRENRADAIEEGELQRLEFLTNQYNLNPRPKMILVVEGVGEKEQYPRLIEELWRLVLLRMGVFVMNLQGVDNFTGGRRKDKYGALEKLIDYYHFQQTLVFVILDQESRVHHVRESLIGKPSTFYPQRFTTRGEYIHLWNSSVEFDNFCAAEIAQAMTEVAKGLYVFQAQEIEDYRIRYNGDPLSKLYKEKLDHGLRKPDLLQVLFGYAIESDEMECEDGVKRTRPIVEVLNRVITLASQNHQPVSYELWKQNQESGFFGELLP